MIGKTVSHYKVLEKLGAGGMGVVYKAQDLRLDRFVALKFLPPYVGTLEEEGARIARERFIQEAKAASALDHSNIGTIYEITETEDGQTFIAMAYYDGETLNKKIARGPIAVEEVVSIARQIAQGVARAHEQGIVHRDIKPANVMVKKDGEVKIIDFGLARLEDVTRITRRGAAVGTVAYMSPEQARGEDVDARTDIWALGVVLYEMMTGELPFRGESEGAMVHSILYESFQPPKAIRKDTPEELDRITARALQKDREVRYQSAAQISKDLADYQSSLSTPAVGVASLKPILRSVRRPFIAIPGALILLALCSLAVWLFDRLAEVRWARERAIPEIIKLAEQEEYITAFNLARKAEPYLPSDSMLEELWPEISRKVSIETTPTAADVYIRDYEAIDSDWQHLGTSPMDNIRIPMGFFRWRIEKEGCRTVEAAHSGASGSLKFTLDEEESIPAGMVRVSGGLSGAPNMEPMQLGDFYIDKYEVTNKRFKNFIESGGYRKREYWKHEFIKDGRILSWEEAMAEFRDATGRPGPSTWELGDYPEGQDDYPVTGISWYEAAAYAEFAGKSLPTVRHWLRAAGPHLAQFIIPSSNFDESGPARVGRYQGMGPFGTYDMAGNVKEWCWNELVQMRYIASGAWEDPSYMFFLPYPQSPFDRSAFNGFRCMKHVSPGAITTEAAKPILPRSRRDYRREKPAPNDIFQVYQRLYTYDKTELNPIIESTDETPRYWTKEKITYDAAYGNERMMGYLFLPKNTSPPYQTVIFFPAVDAQFLRSSEKLRMSSIDFIIRSKRAVLFPIYKSTYERGDGYTFVGSKSPNSYRDHVILWFKDLGRSIDYLESRKDIDCDRLAYHGLSLGALMGSIYAALEKRLKVSILELGGFPTFLPGRLVPEAEQINFAPRVTIPTLMLNGRYDSFLPLETSQIPMFRLLGTPEAHKRHVVYDTGHFIPRNEKIKEILDWLDRYLGPVE